LLFIVPFSDLIIIDVIVLLIYIFSSMLYYALLWMRL